VRSRQVRDLDVMLKDACEFILKGIRSVHVQVYLNRCQPKVPEFGSRYGEVGAATVEAANTGLPLDVNSIHGRAAVEKHSGRGSPIPRRVPRSARTPYCPKHAVKWLCP